jgi:hypothetical protein
MSVPEEMIILPPSDGKVGEGHVQADSYDAELKSVWDIDYTQSPYAIFEQALKTGYVYVTESGLNQKVKCTGVDFRLIDHNTKFVFKESLTMPQARRVMFKGKDTEVFHEAFNTQYQAHQEKLRGLAEAQLAKRNEKGQEILQEDFSNGPQIDGPGNTGSMDTEFIPLGNGPLNQQLTLTDQWSMLAKAFEAWSHNPYAHRAVLIIVNFVLGRGWTVNLADDQLQDEWNVLRLDLGLEQQVYTWMCDLERQGELFLRPVYDISGNLTEIINMEASTILEVITNPENVNEVYGFWQQYQTPVQVYGPGADKSCRYVVNLYSADEVLHVKINAAGSEKRGRSSFFPGLEYLKMVRDYHVANANRAIAEACLVLDWQIDGSPSDVQAFASSISPVNYRKPISSIYHSTAVTVAAVNMSGAKSGAKDNSLDAMISAVALTFGISKDYLGSVNSQTRAGSLITTEPPVKMFEQRQRVLSMQIFYPLIQQWIDRRIQSGGVPTERPATRKTKIEASIGYLRQGRITDAMTQIWSAIKGTPQAVPIDRNIHVKFPEIVKADLAVMIDNCAKMQSMGWWSARRAANMATQEWGGIDTYDYDDELGAIRALGVLPIAVQWSQMPTVDPSNPVDPSQIDQNATDKPAPNQGGVQSKSQRGLNLRNNPHGVGATHLRKAVGR